MANIETLLNKNDETIYPVTKTEAIYNATGTETLDNTLDKKANISTASADTNKMMKADGTKSLVTSSNIDFTTFSPFTVVSGNNTTFTFDVDMAKGKTDNFIHMFVLSTFCRNPLIFACSYSRSGGGNVTQAKNTDSSSTVTATLVYNSSSETNGRANLTITFSETIYGGIRVISTEARE